MQPKREPSYRSIGLTRCIKDNILFVMEKKRNGKSYSITNFNYMCKLIPMWAPNIIPWCTYILTRLFHLLAQLRTFQIYLPNRPQQKAKKESYFAFWRDRARIPMLVTGLTVFIPVITAEENVILLHGLCRTKASMARMEKALKSAGYRVVNVGYPSRTRTIQELSKKFVKEAVQACQDSNSDKIHFVTHSMGGILVRDYLSRHSIANLGRVVMLGPPNQGSEIVDKLGKLTAFKWLNGPAGQQLGTNTNSLPQQLEPVDFPLGVIAGDRSINWINSLMIPGPDDGKVSVQRTRIDGMADHIVLHVTHPFIMKDKDAIQYTISFLKTGSFLKTPE